ncbi:MAG: histidine--tRNA ligase [Acidobacteriota bacterium]
MASTKPARGMRDFLPADVRKRNYVIGVIKEVYESYGFEPLETPAVENIETLMGKYGDEGNQLVFKILKRGEKLDLANAKIESDLSDLALRYDLTVPLARVVANNKNELPKFFKRYQIQPVWRADRPARGRFREFYQCDVDAIGSESMVVESELISAVSSILKRLGFEDFLVKLNHRDLLAGLLEISGVPDRFIPETITILDKLDKIGVDGCLKEIGSFGFGLDGIQNFTSFIAETFQKREQILKESGPHDANQSTINQLAQFVANSSSGRTGLSAVGTLMTILDDSGNGSKLWLDPFLARGLSYYTGTILEIVLTKGDFKGSLGGGGRYDGLIGMFGKEQIPACGFSLGLERILVVMEERGMFPPEIAESRAADVMVTIWDEASIVDSLNLARELRKQGIRVTVYPEPDKLGKQFKYADSTGIPFVCVLGDEERAAKKVKLKNMLSGEECTLKAPEIAAKIVSAA